MKDWEKLRADSVKHLEHPLSSLLFVVRQQKYDNSCIENMVVIQSSLYI